MVDRLETHKNQVYFLQIVMCVSEYRVGSRMSDEKLEILMKVLSRDSFLLKANMVIMPIEWSEGQGDLQRTQKKSWSVRRLEWMKILKIGEAKLTLVKWTKIFKFVCLILLMRILLHFK